MFGEYFQEEGKEGVGDGVLGFRLGVGAASTTNLSMRLCRLANSSAPFPFKWEMSCVLEDPFTSSSCGGFGATGGGVLNLRAEDCMKLQASAPRLRKSSSGPDSKPAPWWSPLGFSSRFCTRESSSGLGEFFFFSSTVLNMGFLLLRRRASCKIPVLGAGIAILCSLEAKGSEAGRGVAGAIPVKGWTGG